MDEVDGTHPPMADPRAAAVPGPDALSSGPLPPPAEGAEEGLERRFEWLRACALFGSADTEELRALAARFEEIRVRAGELVIVQDESDPYLYIVAVGRLEVFRVDAERGEEIPLASVYPGEPLGEMAYFSDRVRSASARAVEPSLLLRIHYDVLSECFERHPEVASAFLAVVTRRLRQNNQLYQENHFRLRSAERSLRDLSEFLDLSDVGALGLGIEGLIERLVHTASSLLDADRGSLFLIDEVTGELWSKVAEGRDVREIRVPPGAGVVGWVAQHRTLANIPDAYEDDRFNPAVDRATGYRTRTILCAPVWSLENRVLGVVQVINKRVGVFTEEDEALLRAFAHQAAVAVENFNLYRRMVLSHRKMSVMLDIARSLGETLDPAELIRRIVDKMAEALGCERSAYFVLDAERQELWSMELRGSELSEIRLPASSGLAGHAALTGEVVRIADAYEDRRFNPEFDARSGYRTRSVLCVPVHGREGEVVGVAQAINKLDGPFDEDDVALLRAICSQIGVAMENAQLYARTEEMRRYLEDVQESISNGLVTLDLDWRIVTLNGAAVRMLSRPRHGGPGGEPGPGADLRSVLGEGNRPLLALLEDAYASRESAHHYDLPFDTGGEEESAVNLSVMPLRDGEGDFRGLVLVLEDITAEKRVKSTLTRYMAKDIVERMLKDPSQQALGGVRSLATVLFSDIRDFTTLAETLTAEQTMDLLNEYFSLMVEEVFRERGVLDKFMGDALMAVYGIPYPQSDDAIRAVRTALNMCKALAAFNRNRVARGDAPIRIGIGINTDEVLSGNMGSRKRMDYTVIGDGVNICARLESLNKQYGTTILLSESTRALLDNQFRLRSVDTVVTKGKSRPVEIFEALGPRELEPGPEIVAYEKGLALYRAGRFGEALEHFGPWEATDGPSRTMASRCRLLLAHPPASWDGVWHALEK